MENSEAKVIFQESAVARILLTQEQEEFEKIKNEDVSKLSDIDEKVFLNACDQVYVIGELEDEESEELVKSVALTSALNTLTPKKEVLILPNKHYMISFKALNFVLKDEKIKNIINKKEIVESMVESNFIEILQNNLAISSIFEFDNGDDLYVLVGKASNAVWDIIDWIANPITTLRFNSNPEKEHSGICLLDPVQVKALFDLYKKTNLEIINKYLDDIFTIAKDDKDSKEEK